MYIRTSEQEERLHIGFGGYTCNWGTHICGLYETPEERDEIIFGFLNRGDTDGDLQLYCHVEWTREDFKQRYKTLYPESNDHLDNSQYFRFFSAKELYYPDGVFSPWKMDDKLKKFYSEIQQKGKRNIRGAAEMGWALEAVPGGEHLMAYESRLNYLLPKISWVGICLYNVTKFSGATIMNVLRTHPYTISGGVITENPYYQDPDEWLAKNAPEFLNRA